MHSLGLCPQLSKVRFPVVDSDVHPINKFAFLALFRMMSVLEVKSNSRFGRSPIIYPVTGILGVPSFLLPIMTSVPLWSQIFPDLLPLYPVTSHFVWCFLSEVFLLLLPRSQLVSLQWIYFSFGILSPSVSPSLPSGFSSLFFCFSNQSRVLFTLCQFYLPQSGVVSLFTHFFVFYYPHRVLFESLFLVSVLLRRIVFSSV